MVSDDEEEGSTPEIIMSSGESSDGSIESRYLNSWCESPSATSRRQARRAASKRWNPTVFKTGFQLVDNSTEPRSPLLQGRQSVDNVEVSRSQITPLLFCRDLIQFNP